MGDPHHDLDCLAGLQVSDCDGKTIDTEAGFAELRTTSQALKKRGGTIFLVGNGASASMASHVAADLAKNAHIRTEVFSDLALITAVANDISYSRMRAVRQTLERLGFRLTEKAIKRFNQKHERLICRLMRFDVS